MQRLEVSGAVRPLYESLGVKELKKLHGKVCIGFIWPRIETCGHAESSCEHGMNLRDQQNARSLSTVPTELTRLLSSLNMGIYWEIILKCIYEKGGVAD